MHDTPPAPNLHQLLRQRTAEAHGRLESRIAGGGYFDARDRYALLLQRFYGFYAAVEPPLAARPEWTRLGMDYEARRRLAHIAGDLVALGWGIDAVERLPRCAAAPDASRLPEALGLMYVLEGSTLGGQIIARRLHAVLGVTPAPGGGGQFFGSYGPRIGRMWRDFCAALEAYGDATDHAHDERVAAGAVDTFVKLERWLLDAPGATAAA